MLTRSNLNSLFAEFARYSRDLAVVHRHGYRREAWTYAKLSYMAHVCAHQLRGRGARTGDRILLWGPNSGEWMAAFWGCLLLGAVAVPLDQGSTPEFAARVARETSARVIVASRDAAGLIITADKPPHDSLGAPVPCLLLEDLPHIAARQGNFFLEQKSQTRPWYETLADKPITRDHIAQILFTSGTTAEPRGVVLTHGNFLANLEPLERGIDSYRKYERWLHPLRFVTLVPMSHVFGQFMALFVPPLLGATIVFEPSANPSEITRSIKRERATALIAVPRMLDGLHGGLLRDLESRGGRKRFDVAFASADGKKFLHRAWLFHRIHHRFGWKFWSFISGGAALSPDTEAFFKRIGYAVVQGYGMTETASLISLNHPFHATQGSIGKVLPGREFKLADDGEILVRGDNVAAGYWEAGVLRPSEQTGTSTEASLPAGTGWLRTGDIGELDAEGNLHFRGRKKNVIVTPAGLNIYPEDLESALRQQAGVRDCVVVPIERNANAEPCAVLLPADPIRSSSTGTPAPASDARDMNSPSNTNALHDAIDSANATLAEYQRIRTWLIWPDADFPRTPTGKPKLGAIAAAVKQILGETQPGASIDRTPTGQLEDLLARFTTQAAGTSLDRGLSLTSLDRVELMSALEDRYQVELSETAFAEAKTVADVERLLSASSSSDMRNFAIQSNLEEPLVARFKFTYPRWAQRWPTRWLRLAVYYALVWPATQILGHPKIIGRGNLSDLHGPILIVSNHITRRADIGLILAALPIRFRHRLAIAMGGETLRRMRRPPREWLFAKRWSYQVGYWLVTAFFNVFPLPQFSGFRESFRFAGESVDRGYSVVVFPEGETNESTTGEMAKFQSGIGLLAENLRVPIVPMRLDGVWKMKREHRRLARFGEITVRIATPVKFPPGTPPGEIAEHLQSLVSNA
jgi:long-chain acyl-CoA synthetase